jgi:hypothetical protein
MKKRKTDEKLPDIQITELFLVKADWNRTFMGQIIRETTVDGQELIRGNVIINEGKAWSIGNTEEELGNNLDDICTLKLDKNLHGDPGRREVIAGIPFFLN